MCIREHAHNSQTEKLVRLIRERKHTDGGLKRAARGFFFNLISPR